MEYQFIDLGLPSGTLWANINGADATAPELPGVANLPTAEQFYELFANCKVESIFEDEMPAFRLTGSNGNAITLPRAGYGRPIYRMDLDEVEPKYHRVGEPPHERKPREYERMGFDVAFYRTCDYKDTRNVVVEITPDNIWHYATENTYRFSVRTIKNK